MAIKEFSEGEVASCINCGELKEYQYVYQKLPVHMGQEFWGLFCAKCKMVSFDCSITMGEIIQSDSLNELIVLMKKDIEMTPCSQPKLSPQYSMGLTEMQSIMDDSINPTI